MAAGPNKVGSVSRKSRVLGISLFTMDVGSVWKGISGGSVFSLVDTEREREREKTRDRLGTYIIC